MDSDQLRHLFERVQAGELSPEAAVGRMEEAGQQTPAQQTPGLPLYEDIGFARIDHDRQSRCGMPEVIFAEGKTPEQVAEIFVRLRDSGADVLATRVGAEAAAAVLKRVPAAQTHTLARCMTLRQHTTPASGKVGVVCAGTSDLPVAEEAAVTAELFGVEVTRVVDVGVAGLHRLLAQVETLRQMDVLIVCAGMEGALPSVVGGLVRVPVLAVPTSVGYGASFGGVAALLGMLNACSPNICVVNIDNGFGAGYLATLIARR
jgi:NCAIR mutase (PurE)-related protein